MKLFKKKIDTSTQCRFFTKPLFPGDYRMWKSLLVSIYEAKQYGCLCWECMELIKTVIRTEKLINEQSNR